MRLTIIFIAAILPLPALASGEESWAIHGQATFVDQYHPGFRSPYRGTNSLDAGSRGNETADITLFVGLSPWSGGELWANVEMDQGFGVSNTLGIAAFPSAEAYKVGSAQPYGRLHRLFFRQTLDLGGETQSIEGTANQLAGDRKSENLTVSIGKFAVTDIFDTNKYAHDPRGDFLNWAIVDAGAFDYAADAWAYTYGIAAEWSFGDWTVRSGLFDMSRTPNSTKLETSFGQFEIVGEVERRLNVLEHDGKIKILGFLNRGRMGSYSDALALATSSNSFPDTSLARRYRSRVGAAFNIEQGLTDDLGAFVRASINDGSQESYEFTDINRSISAGISLNGDSWERKHDTVGLAIEAADISNQARKYLAAGGLGLLVGDGQLKQYAPEAVGEAYYDAEIVRGINVALDYQLIVNPAYNADRGPVSLFAFRVHGYF